MCAATSELETVKGVRFRYGGNNPSHQQLVDLVTHNLNRRKFSVAVRKRMAHSLRQLYGARIIADYRPGWVVDEIIARDCLHQAAYVLRTCEVSNV